MMCMTHPCNTCFTLCCTPSLTPDVWTGQPDYNANKCDDNSYHNHDSNSNKNNDNAIANDHDNNGNNIQQAG